MAERLRPRAQEAAVLFIATVLGIAALYFAKPAIAPVLLAVLFALLLSSVVDRLQRLRVPRTLAAAGVVLVVCAVLAGVVDATWQPATQWAAKAPETARAIEKKIKPLQRWMSKVDAGSRQAMATADQSAGTAAPTAPNAVAPVASPTKTVLLNSPAVVISVFSVILMTFFILVATPNLMARLEKRRGADDQPHRAIHLLNDVRSELGRYLGMIALINAGLGVATFGAMAAFGMPTPVLWGTVAALLNFVPYLGSAITLTLLTVVALVTFDGLALPAGVAATYLCLAAIEGQIVQPLLVGKRLKVHPLAIFLAVWLGSWLWGVIGIVLAVPCLVALKVTAEHLGAGSAIIDLLNGGEAPPSRDQKRSELEHSGRRKVVLTRPKP